MISQSTHSTKIKLSVLSALITFAISPFGKATASHPISQSLMHSRSIDINEIESDDELIEQLHTFFASEKLDGIRAIWTGRDFVTRQGNPINAPLWFIESLPMGTWLEGELWIERQQFQQLSSIVLDQKPNERHWKQVKFMIFDSPSLNASFADRLHTIEALINSINKPYIQKLPQFEISRYQDLDRLLDKIISKGGEGIMLHRKNNLYRSGKSHALIKIKPYQDAEAVVIGYEPGKGKYSGQMGAIWVITPDNKKFKIGTGFSDHERQTPPALGKIVQYRFNGYTDSGVPRFARFLKVRASPES